MEEVLIDPLEHTAKLRKNLISEVYNKYRFSVDECSHEGYLEYLKNNELSMLTKEEKEWVIKLYTRKSEINKLKDPAGPKEICTSEYFFREKPTSIYI
ncbi:unnamed protein product [Rhizophagus irregularis]|nr:unnamed protein product [Rhizophagus irregularis]